MYRMLPDDIEIYIHIPFCISKCNYCDFLSFPCDKKSRQAYVEALLREIVFDASIVNQSGSKVSSIFVGGGTPTVLSANQLKEIFTCLKDHFQVRPDAEITVEANPGTLTLEKLGALYESGVNRLSMGLQPSDDSLLKVLGRIHNWEEFTDNYSNARKMGFDNINIDLMSSLPGQTLDGYEKTLETVLNLKPDHISSYSLIIEEGTPFASSEDILAKIPDEDTDRLMYERTKEILHQYGYERYEISNYAKPGRECRHNLGYWSDVPYLGVGLGASSYIRYAEEEYAFLPAVRFRNTTDIKAYLKDIRPWNDRDEYITLSVTDQMEEFMFLGLRKMKGVSAKDFARKFGKNLEEIYGKVIVKYIRTGFLQWKSDYLSLTDQGIDVSNHIFSEFLFD